MSRVPDIPGFRIPRGSEQDLWLKQHVAKLCQLDHDRFPGSHPVSFSLNHLAELERRDYWVCEKSDGIRVLFFLQTDPQGGSQAVYLIDRHNSYYEVSGFWFPHPDRPRDSLMDTILDGELVVDVEPTSKRETLRYLVFDCLVFDNENVMSRSLDKRYGRLKERFYRPWCKVREQFPQMSEKLPFDIQVKDISFSYGIEDVFRLVIPKLQHGNDGLIYTCRETPYVSGTDTNILKWKPPSENSIDFKLVLRFPPSESNPSQPEFHAKPFFGLHMYCGDESGQSKYEPYDELHVEDDEWEQMKLSGEQIDDRVVEVHWDSERDRWRMMRFRDDKPHGNFRTVVNNIIQSIADGVEKPMLLARCPVIRSAWKARLAQSQQSIGSQSSIGSQLPPGHSGPNGRQNPPPATQFRYGPIAASRWSKVSGPEVFAGMKR